MSVSSFILFLYTPTRALFSSADSFIICSGCNAHTHKSTLLLILYSCCSVYATFNLMVPVGTGLVVVGKYALNRDGLCMFMYGVWCYSE